MGARAAGDDPFVRQELVETAYHVLWELVHVFFEHRGLLSRRSVHDAGASSFLYPFLGEQETDLEAVVADVRASVLMKAAEVGALRAQTLTEGRATLLAAAAELRAALDAGGRLLALGNGGSATDAMDAWPTSVAAGAAGRRGRRSTSPRTRRSSRRSPTTSASRRSSPARSSPTAARATRCSRSRPAAARRT